MMAALSRRLLFGPDSRGAGRTARLLVGCVAAACCLAATAVSAQPAPSPSLAAVIDGVQPKIVKIYGAGGLAGLEAYQSGFLISEQGHILTVWSYVLDTDTVTIVLDDGRKFQAELVGSDPRLELAVLKIDAQDLPYFNLDEAQEVAGGARVLAFSNLFGVAVGDEDASVLHGRVMARTALDARRGAFQTPYRGPVYVLDAITNNPGSAGGAVTDRQGRLIGVIGKELRNSLTNIWLNYAVPIGEVTAAVDDILAGRIRPRSADMTVRRPAEPLTLAMLGIATVPDVLVRTPPFIDRVQRESAADKAGLRPDDLILFVNDRVVSSCQTLVDELGLIDRGGEVTLMVQRRQELIEVTLRAER